jgi:phosphoribosyl-AMP cyclohydrolase
MGFFVCDTGQKVSQRCIRLFYTSAQRKTTGWMGRINTWPASMTTERAVFPTQGKYKTRLDSRGGAMYFLLDGFYRPFAPVQFNPAASHSHTVHRHKWKCVKAVEPLEKWPDYLTAQQSLLAAQRDFLSLEARTSKWFKYTNRGKKKKTKKTTRKQIFSRKEKGWRKGKVSDIWRAARINQKVLMYLSFIVKYYYR